MTHAALPLPARPTVATALGLVFLGGALTGFAPIIARLSELGPLGTAGWRMAIAALIMVPFAMAQRRPGTLPPRDAGLVALAGLMFAVDLGFFHVALNMTSVAHATLLVNLAPVVALGAGAALFGERLTGWKIGGLVAALAGAALMTLMRADVGGTLAGNALALTGMLGYAAYLIVVKQARARVSTLDLLLGSSTVCAAVLFLAAAASGERLLPATPEGLGVLVLLGLVGHAMGQGLVARGMGQAPVGVASILLLVQPVVAAVAAWMIFGERMGLVETLGAVLVLAGIALASRARS